MRDEHLRLRGGVQLLITSGLNFLLRCLALLGRSQLAVDWHGGFSSSKIIKPELPVERASEVPDSLPR